MKNLNESQKDRNRRLYPDIGILVDEIREHMSIGAIKFTEGNIYVPEIKEKGFIYQAPFITNNKGSDNV